LIVYKAVLIPTMVQNVQNILAVQMQFNVIFYLHNFTKLNFILKFIL